MNGPIAAVVIFFLLMCVKRLLLSLTPLLRYDTHGHTKHTQKITYRERLAHTYIFFSFFLSRQVRARRMTVGPRAIQSKNAATSLLEREKAWGARQWKHSRMPLKVIDSCTTCSSYVHTWIHFCYVLCTNIITMTHTINSNTNLLSIDIKRTHTQMKKSPGGEKGSGKEMRRDRK